MSSGDRAPMASKYSDYRREAVREMSRSTDKELRAAALQLQYGKIPTESALKIVRRRLADINTGSDEAASLRFAVRNIDAMRQVEKSSHVAEHRASGSQSLHDVLTDALKNAGLRDRVQRDEIAVILSMISRGASLEDAVLHQAETIQGALSGLGSAGLVRGNTAPGLRPWISFAREARAKGHK